MTAEDPVEIELEGIIQTQVNLQISLDFSRLLRTFLRQDPDIIMLGEIRDEESAFNGIKSGSNRPFSAFYLTYQRCPLSHFTLATIRHSISRN